MNSQLNNSWSILHNAKCTTALHGACQSHTENQHAEKHGIEFSVTWTKIILIFFTSPTFITFSASTFDPQFCKGFNSKTLKIDMGLFFFYGSTFDNNNMPNNNISTQESGNFVEMHIVCKMLFCYKSCVSLKRIKSQLNLDFLMCWKFYKNANIYCSKKFCKCKATIHDEQINKRTVTSETTPGSNS